MPLFSTFSVASANSYKSNFSQGLYFVGGAITNKAASTSGTTTMPLDSGLTGGISSSAEKGDFVIALYAVSSTLDVALSITDGTTEYNLIGSELYGNSTADINLRIAYKFITDDTSTTFGPTGQAGIVDGNGSTAVYVFRNVDTTTPLDGVTPTTSTSTTTRLANPPAITPITKGSYIVCAGAGGTGTSGVGPYSTPSDLTGWFTDVRSGASAFSGVAITGIGHKDDWVSGEFNPSAFTLAAGADSTAAASAAISFVLRPA